MPLAATRLFYASETYLGFDRVPHYPGYEMDFDGVTMSHPCYKAKVFGPQADGEEAAASVLPCF